MMGLKMLGGHDCDSPHLDSTCLGKRAICVFQHGCEILDCGKCGYTTGNFRDVFLWDGCLGAPPSLETVMNADFSSLN